MTVYTEGTTIPESRSLHDVSGWSEFQEQTAHIKPDSYLYDIRRFSHKVYAQLDAFKLEHRYIVWLDGDVVVKQNLTKPFLKRLLNGGFCAFLGRQGCYTETGFLIFDTKHDDFPEFERRYRAQYDQKLLLLQQYWIDCIAFDVSRHGLEANNLTPEVYGMVNVFDKSPLAPYMEHRKGNLKWRENEPVRETV